MMPCVWLLTSLGIFTNQRTGDCSSCRIDLSLGRMSVSLRVGEGSIPKSISELYEWLALVSAFIANSARVKVLTQIHCADVTYPNINQASRSEPGWPKHP